MSITIIPTPVLNTIVTNTIDIKSSEIEESLLNILKHERLNNKYNKIKIDEDLTIEDDSEEE